MQVAQSMQSVAAWRRFCFGKWRILFVPGLRFHGTFLGLLWYLFGFCGSLIGRFGVLPGNFSVFFPFFCGFLLNPYLVLRFSCKYI